MAHDNKAAATDPLIKELVSYIISPVNFSDTALDTARLCLMDSTGCALQALDYPECIAHLGPIVPEAATNKGAKVIGTGDLLDPVKAAFDIGALIRWLDYNDTWLAAEWGHPSDNLGGLLAVMDYLSRNNIAGAKQNSFTIGDLLEAMIKAHEIQGVIALENSFNQVGLCHVMLVKIATAGICAKLLGGDEDQITSAVSHAWIDGQSLRTYRHAPNTSQRKSWAAGDATSRGVRLALMTTRSGLTQLPSALSAPIWGFADVLFNGKVPVLARKLGCYVMENILFKVSFPAEFHAQTAVECAFLLHPQVSTRLDEIKSIDVTTQESAVRIISKDGELRNYADRDHCLQYMIAVGLIEGNLDGQHYLDEYAANPMLDKLRSLMEVKEEESFSRDYLDPEKRSIANSIQVHFNDGTSTDKVVVEYPLGHRRRRDESRPHLFSKFTKAVSKHLGNDRSDELESIFKDANKLDSMKVCEFLDLYTCKK